MANLKITNVPQASSVTTSNDFYVKIGTTFRRVPISALVTLLESSGFVKAGADGITQDEFAKERVAISYFTEGGASGYISNRSCSQIMASIDVNYEIAPVLQPNENDEYAGMMLEASSSGVVFAFLDVHTANDPRLLIMTVTDQNYDIGITTESYPAGHRGLVVPAPEAADIGKVFKATAAGEGGWEAESGGGGTASVTPTAVATAIAGMSAQQKTDSRTNLGAETAGAAATVQTNLDAVTAKIPSDASSSNKMATQADLPVFSNRDSSTDTVEVKQDPTTRKCYVPTSSGPAVPTPTSSDNGKYLKVVNGAYVLGSAPSGGGVSIYSVDIVYDTGYWYIRHDGLDIAAEDIFTALNGGDLVQVIDDAGAECELMAINYSPGEGLLVYKSCNLDNNTPEWRVFTIQDTIVQGAPRADVTMSQIDLLPLSDSRTVSEIGSGFTVAGNTVYTVSGTISGFTLITSTLPTMLPGQCVEIRLTVGSTAITTPTWPSWCNLMNGWDGTFAASTYYDIVIDDAGNVFHSTREVSA